MGAIEAGALMESIEGECCSEPPTSSPSTRNAVLVDFMGKIIALSRSAHSSAEQHLVCSFGPWVSVLMCPPRLSTHDDGGL